MKQKQFFITFFVTLCFSGFTQHDNKPSLTWSGFVKTDFFYDTRQSPPALALREGHFYLFPDSIMYDRDSIDINGRDAFHILSIQTRIRANITGPDVLKAKTTATIESEFFGTSETDVNGFRLRHAYVQLKWKTTEVLAGQFWHPMFPVHAIPGTISFNTGTPFIPFSRNPQLKISQSLLPVFSFNITAFSERDFVSNGPDGPSSRYFRNAARPGINAELMLKADSIQFLFIAGANYHTLLPELKTSKNYRATETVDFLSYYTYMQKKIGSLTCKGGASLIQNGHNVMMLGGYAVAQVTDTAKDYKTYTPYNTFSSWADVQLKIKKWNFGLYGGYSENLGTNHNISGKRYARGTHVAYLYRISPRLAYTYNQFTAAFETEITAAAYGTPQIDGTVKKKYEVRNFRYLLAVIFSF